MPFSFSKKVLQTKHFCVLIFFEVKKNVRKKKHLMTHNQQKNKFIDKIKTKKL